MERIPRRGRCGARGAVACGAALLGATLPGLAPLAAAAPLATRLAWANRLTWGIVGGAAAPDSRYSAAEDPSNPRWLEAQFKADGGLPPAAAALVAPMVISRVPFVDLVRGQDAAGRAANARPDPADRQAAREASQKALSLLYDEARTRSLLRALYAPDQLREQMTWFWTNHFSVQAGKRDIRPMIGDYEDRIRALAFGRFRDLVATVLTHPAMLRYLDADQNAAGHLNENYARELLELHTMGVGSGYSQADVQELARILTGIGVAIDPATPRLKPEWQPLYRRDGLFEFNPARHDFGTKHFLGREIAGSGFAEVEQAIDLIVAAPATARHVARQLATFFVGDDPPPALVDRLAASFQRSHGDIAQMLRLLCRSPEFAASLGHAFKDPAHYVISAIRFAYGDRVIANPRPALDWIARLGEPGFGHETPDGYPLDAAAWSGPGQMAARFDLAHGLGGSAAGLFRAPGSGDDQPAFPQLQNAIFFAGLADGLGPNTRAALAAARSPQEWNALFLSSPEFMRR